MTRKELGRKPYKRESRANPGVLANQEKSDVDSLSVNDNNVVHKALLNRVAVRAERIIN